MCIHWTNLKISHRFPNLKAYSIWTNESKIKARNYGTRGQLLRNSTIWISNTHFNKEMTKNLIWIRKCNLDHVQLVSECSKLRTSEVDWYATRIVYQSSSLVCNAQGITKSVLIRFLKIGFFGSKICCSCWNLVILDHFWPFFQQLQQIFDPRWSKSSNFIQGDFFNRVSLQLVQISGF